MRPSVTAKRFCSASNGAGALGRLDEPRLLNTSLNHFDVRPVTWCPAERRVAGDDRRTG